MFELIGILFRLSVSLFFLVIFIIATYWLIWLAYILIANVTNLLNK